MEDKNKKPTSFFVVDFSENDIEVNNEFICTKIEETKFDKRVYLRGKSKWIEQNTIKNNANCEGGIKNGI